MNYKLIEFIIIYKLFYTYIKQNCKIESNITLQLNKIEYLS